MGFPPRRLVRRRAARCRATPACGAASSTTWSGATPTYFEDFWTVPGYLGADPPPSLLDARMQHKTTVTERDLAARGHRARPADADGACAAAATDDVPVALRCGRRPRRQPPRRDARSHERRAAERAHVRRRACSDDHRHRPASARMHFEAPAPARGRRRGARSTTRSTSPSRPTTATRCPTDEYPSGTSSAPAASRSTRSDPRLIGPDRVAPGRRGSIQSGRFAGKMIVVQIADGRGRLPRGRRDWYRTRVQQVARRPHRRPLPALVRRPRHAHRRPTVDAGRTRPTARPDDPDRQLPRRAPAGAARPRAPGSRTTGRRLPPARTTRSSTARSSCPDDGRERRGIQPVVDAHRQRRRAADVAVGEDGASSSALVEVPPGTGTIVAAEWDFEGAGEFPEPTEGLDGSATPPPPVDQPHVHASRAPTSRRSGWRPTARVTSTRRTPGS